MEEILDQEFNENEKDETRINRLTAFSRYFYCAYVGFKRVFFGTQMVIAERDTQDRMLLSLIFLLSILLFAVFVYYNIRQAKLERTMRVVIPTFNRTYILIFMFYIGFLLFKVCTGLVGVSIYSFSAPFISVIPSLLEGIIFLGILVLVFIREYVYLKRLKNQTNE